MNDNFYFEIIDAKRTFIMSLAQESVLNAT